MSMYDNSHTLKPDTWYKLENGEFVEIKDETT